MIEDFIRGSYNSEFIQKAIRQERQLAYFTSLQIQEDFVKQEFLGQLLEKDKETDDYFLNYIKSIFKKKNNFLTFCNYLRFPLPSTKIVQNRIIPNLRRVLWAENSLFRYDVDGVETTEYLKELNINKFNEDILNALFSKHNSILLTDLRADIPNAPYRDLIDIKDVVSITEKNNDVDKIAIKAAINYNGEQIPGYFYVDDKTYAFYDKEFNLIGSVEHDLGHTPAHYISPKTDMPVVRESLFSYIREELEEYVFLKTVQKMVEPNGAYPIITYLKSSHPNKKENLNLDNEMSSAKVGKTPDVTDLKEGIMEVGTTIGVPIIKKSDGSIDIDVAKNYINFFYTPVASLKYLNSRIKEIESSIVTTLVGDEINSKEVAKNEEQVDKSISIFENTLRKLSDILSRIGTLAHTDFLGLKYGIERINDITNFYGSKFFLETEDMLYESFKNAPNPIERRNVLIRIYQNRYKNNSEQLNRQQILYNLLPYSSDKDFDTAISKGNVSDVIFEFQTRFNYWISVFESRYGDIVTFFNNFEVSLAERYKLIDNLINKLITEQLSSIKTTERNVSNKN